MIDHTTMEVRDLKRSKAFYEKALAPLGIKLVADLPQWKAAGFGTDRPRFWIGEDNSKLGDPDTVHFAFAAKDRAQVRAFYEAAIAAGAKDNGKPGLRPYHENYYGAFVLDPDGYNIEACCHHPE